MERTNVQTWIAILVIAVMAMGCASSYRDRRDALGAPDGSVGDDEGAADDGGGLISRDEILHSGACIVNADCVSTKHCELGACVAECGEGVQCAEGLVCSARGSCVESESYVDVDPPIKIVPPVLWGVDKSLVQLDPGDAQEPIELNVGLGGALQYRVQVEPKEAAGAVILSDSEGSVGSGGSKSIDVHIDRSAFGEGDHRISVGVISDAGQHMVAYEFSNGIAGRYAGVVNYAEPGLGRIPLVVELDVDESGDVHGRIVTEGSLLFPEERALTGHYDKASGSIFFAAMDLYESGSAFDPFERDIGREVYFYGEIDEHRIIQGGMEEVISGLLPQSVSVTGDFIVSRIDTDVDLADLPADPAMPAFPVIAGDYEVCGDWSAACNDFVSGFPLNMIGCSQELRAAALHLNEDFYGVNSEGYEILNYGMVSACATDVVGEGSGACADMTSIACLRNNQQHFLLNTLAQASEYDAYFEDLKNAQRVYAFVGNDLLVEAYRTSSSQVSSPLTHEIALLEDALAKYAVAERLFYETGNMTVMGNASSAVLAQNNYELFRVPLQYVRSSHSALKRIVGLILRRDLSWPNRKAALRQRIQEHARIIFLEGIALARLVNNHGGAFENELAQIADELKGLARTEATLEGDLNPIGYPVDYVPFIYDPSDAMHATNFAQLLDMASGTTVMAVRKADHAQSTTELMEVRLDEIQQRMTDIEMSYEAEIRQICGANSSEFLDDCGQSSSELATVLNDIEQQEIQVRKAEQQLMDLYQLVKIKRDTALQILSIRQSTLEFLDATGARLEVLDLAEGQIRSSGSILGALGSIFKGVGMAVASAVAPGATVGAVIGGVASGVSGIQSGAAAISSGGKSKKLARIAKQRTHIQNLQQMRFQSDTMQIEALQAVAQVKELLINMAQMRLDIELAELRLIQHVIRANNLLERVDYLTHQRDVLQAQAWESVNNPLSNLSFRIKRDHAVLMASNEFTKALGDVYLAARALEYELNVDLPQIEAQLFQVNSARQLSDYVACLDRWYDDYAIAYGVPHQEVARLSLREDVLGFTDSVVDEVSGEVITPQEIFRRVVFDPKYITSTGGIEFPFITSIAGKNKHFSSLVCNDRIKSIRVMLVGDYLGDNEATVMLRQEGNSYLRDCAADPSAGNDLLNTYHLDDRNGLIQAGVNDFGLVQGNYELTGRSVASDRWVLVIPSPEDAPNNADIDLLSIDDVVIEVTHEARTLNGDAQATVFSQCNI